MLFIKFFSNFITFFHEGNLTDIIIYRQQSHICKRKVLLVKTKNLQSAPLTAYVVQWNAKIFWLKQTTDFKSIQHKNIKIIISQELYYKWEGIYVTTAPLPQKSQ
jgi:hypothetical protein